MEKFKKAFLYNFTSTRMSNSPKRTNSSLVTVPKSKMYSTNHQGNIFGAYILGLNIMGYPRGFLIFSTRYADY